MVGGYAIELLRHPAVETSQPSLHVRHRNVHLCGGECTRKSRVRISVYDHDVRAIGVQVRLDGLEHAAGLKPLGTGTYSQVGVGAWDLELRKKYLRHRVVIMLSGMDDPVLDAQRGGFHRPRDGRNLHELWTRTDDADGAQLAGH